MFNRVREFREARQLTQENLADALDVSRQTVISIEAGKFNPSLELTFRIARLFHRHIEEIFSDDGFYPHLIAIPPIPAVPDGDSPDGETVVFDAAVPAPAPQENP